MRKKTSRQQWSTRSGARAFRRQITRGRELGAGVSDVARAGVRELLSLSDSDLRRLVAGVDVEDGERAKFTVYLPLPEHLEDLSIVTQRLAAARPAAHVPSLLVAAAAVALEQLSASAFRTRLQEGERPVASERLLTFHLTLEDAADLDKLVERGNHQDHGDAIADALMKLGALSARDAKGLLGMLTSTTKPQRVSVVRSTRVDEAVSQVSELSNQPSDLLRAALALSRRERLLGSSRP